jgi:predicted Zn finger-like uncharacterized protein
MAARVTCPNCQAIYHLPDELVGKSLRCKHCRHTFRPAASPTEESPAPPAPAERVTAAPPGTLPAPDLPPVPEPPRDRDEPAPRRPEPRRRFPLLSLAATLLGSVLAGGLAGAGAVWLGPAAPRPGPAPDPADPVAAIGPAPLSGERVTVTLPSPADQVCVGGAGRYLVFHLPRDQRLAVFDATTAKVVTTPGLRPGNVKIAAGRDVILVAYCDTRLVERLNLRTFEVEDSATLTTAGPVARLAMGSAGDGPALIDCSGQRAPRPEAHFLDLKTLRYQDVTFQPGPPAVGPQAVLHASADGRLFTLGDPGGPVLRLTLTADACGVSGATPARNARPGPDGRYVYTADGVLTADLQPEARKGSPCVPADHGPFYLGAAPDKPGVTVHAAGDHRPLATVPGLDLAATLTDAVPVGGAGIPPADRVHFIPAAHLVVVVSAAGDSLALYRFDVEKALDQADADYLVVTTPPAAAARPGEEYASRLAGTSRRGGVKFELDLGPPGMTLRDDGTLDWPVPADFAGRTADVLLTMSDAAGRGKALAYKVAVAGPQAAPRPDAEPVKDAPLVPAPAAAVEIRPPALAEDSVTVSLPSAAADVCVGGAGRYLVFHLPAEGRLAVFDVSEARLTGSVPLPDDKVLFAAGMDKLLVVLPERGAVQRWALAPVRKEATAALPFGRPVIAVAMGSATDGPLVVRGPRGPAAGAAGLALDFLDVPTLRRVAVDRVEGTPAIGEGEAARIRVSADGRLVAVASTARPNAPLQTVLLAGNVVRVFNGDADAGLPVPAADGRLVCTNSGPYSALGRRLDARTGPADITLPAVHGDAWLSFVAGKDRRLDSRLHLAGDSRVLATLPALEGLGKADDFAASPWPHDKRLFLIPRAKVVVTLPVPADKVHLRRFDPDEAALKGGVDYLAVTGDPAPAAVKGTTFSYPLSVKARKGGAACKLEAGPAGMKVSPEGRVTWDVPADFGRGEAAAVVSVRDAGGQAGLLAFTVAVRGPDGTPAGPAGAEPPLKGWQPPPVPPPDVRPAPLDADRVEVKLTSPADDVCVGGGGRFLVLHLPAERRLVVFDASAARLVGSLPLPGDNVKFTAGRDTLLVVFAEQRVVSRYRLETLEPEATALLPGPDRVTGVAMGSVSRGPLLVQGAGPAVSEQLFLDPETFRRLDLPVKDRPGFQPGVGRQLRASADGTLFTASNRAGGPCQAIVPEADGYRAADGANGTAGVPSPDGRWVFATDGLYGPQLKPAGPRKGPCVPVHGSPLYLCANPKPPAAGAALDPTLFYPGDDRPLARVGADDLTGVFGGPLTPGRLAADQAVHLIPAAELLVVIPPPYDKLVLRRFDLEKVLAKADFDFLFVTSRPPPAAERGTTFGYRVEALSRKGGVRVDLTKGPPGLEVTGDGRVRWEVPADFAEAAADVTLTVTDASGQKAVQEFRLMVRDKAP